MVSRVLRVFARFWSAEEGPYALLSLLFLTIFIVSPLLSAQMVKPVILQSAFWLIVVTGALQVNSKRLRLVALGAALLALVLRWVGVYYHEIIITNLDIFLSLGMLAVFALLMVHSFLVGGRSWGHRIAAAVAVYLLLGLIWARIYEAIETFSPGSIHSPPGEPLNSASFVYFSFVTLATVGYGDFTPVNAVARNLATLEAITGQLYMVILIARLVSERWVVPEGRKRW